MIRALVLPLAEKLDDKDGGPCYLQFIAQLLRDPDFFKGKIDQRKNPTVEKLMQLTAAKLTHLPDPICTARIELEVNLLFYVLANYSRQWGKSAKSTPKEKALVVNNLIDSIVAILNATVGSETKRALRKPRSASARSDKSRARS